MNSGKLNPQLFARPQSTGGWKFQLLRAGLRVSCGSAPASIAPLTGLITLTLATLHLEMDSVVYVSLSLRKA